ncbi:MULTISPECIES: hypothetical protein [Haloferax]|uniref:Uncharacterized protein n=2 Tax=Haloferax TaxID=2251 RepID=A0A6G1Z7R2_9EURY|nr:MULTISPECIES: hypothetical protein [Haloferax]KAB1184825.1 hypothetical protein Hfx1149_17335 [Haloferax sp. CBA1149]MRW82458.1 hypothetical protein [Haloferax marinisediminis]
MSEQVCVYWDDSLLSDRTGFAISGLTADGEPSHKVKISEGADGFVSVFARPENGNRTVALALESSPEPGVYIFEPKYAGYDFEVRLEYPQEPYPSPAMQTYEVTSPLCAVEVGDTIDIGLRKDVTTTPGVKHVEGRVIDVADCCGLLPDTPPFDIDPDTVLSILVNISDEKGDVEKAQAVSAMLIRRRLSSVGNKMGVLNITGTENPLEFDWEGRSDTPHLQVESVTVTPEKGEPWTVENEGLSELQFNPLADYSTTERVEELQSAFAEMPDVTVSERTLEVFATAVTAEPPDMSIECHYKSRRSGNVLMKSGKLREARSVYYAESNRAKHQIRFADNEATYYLLVDTDNTASESVSVYTVAENRHWDSELGPLVELELTGSQ